METAPVAWLMMDYLREPVDRLAFVLSSRAIAEQALPRMHERLWIHNLSRAQVLTRTLQHRAIGCTVRSLALSARAMREASMQEHIVPLLAVCTKLRELDVDVSQVGCIVYRFAHGHASSGGSGAEINISKGVHLQRLRARLTESRIQQPRHAGQLALVGALADAYKPELLELQHGFLPTFTGCMSSLRCLEIRDMVVAVLALQEMIDSMQQSESIHLIDVSLCRRRLQIDELPSCVDTGVAAWTEIVQWLLHAPRGGRGGKLQVSIDCNCENGMSHLPGGFNGVLAPALRLALTSAFGERGISFVCEYVSALQVSEESPIHEIDREASNG